MQASFRRKVCVMQDNAVSLRIQICASIRATCESATLRNASPERLQVAVFFQGGRFANGET